MPRPAKPTASVKRRTKAGPARSAKHSASRPPRKRALPQSTTSTGASLAAAAPRPSHRWTFLTNHAHVLILLKAQPELILREVASRVGITERAVQRIVHDLEAAGFIQRQKIGRQNQYQVLAEQPLRHPIEAHRTIGDLLRLILG